MFSPGRTLNVPVGSSSVTLDVDSDASAVRIVNSGDGMVFVRLDGQPATAADYPLMPKSENVILKGVGAGKLSMIGVQSGIVYVTTGAGSP